MHRDPQLAIGVRFLLRPNWLASGGIYVAGLLQKHQDRGQGGDRGLGKARD